MRQTTRIRYADAGSLQVAAIPYDGNELSMVLLVPKEIGGLADAEKDLSAENMEKWIAAAQPQDVELYLPRFRMEAQFQLADTLRGMGMASAFSSRANFSGMDGTRDLFLSAVVHKAFVDVNEEGTEAAAATGVVARVASAPPPPPVVRADRPFVFLIRHEATGNILFLGRVKRPQG
jgi:serpin B